MNRNTVELLKSIVAKDDEELGEFRARLDEMGFAETSGWHRFIQLEMATRKLKAAQAEVERSTQLLGQLAQDIDEEDPLIKAYFDAYAAQFPLPMLRTGKPGPKGPHPLVAIRRMIVSDHPKNMNRKLVKLLDQCRVQLPTEPLRTVYRTWSEWYRYHPKDVSRVFSADRKRSPRATRHRR